MLVVCDSMKIVEVPEEGRRRFIFRKAEKRGSNSKKRKSKNKLKRSFVGII